MSVLADAIAAQRHQHTECCTYEVCGIGPTRDELVAQSRARWEQRHGPGSAEPKVKRVKATEVPI